ncbi:putative quinol monooxygenase [Rhodococcus opacus]|uniref:putative quinol monooxygenase n=1 Tax=Rhodococcus opacus TaxID=37919 RepID=UPI0024A6AA23|nr:antibiotic biosynthesis monooxygenase [Rhodococcus opacus]
MTSDGARSQELDRTGSGPTGHLVILARLKLKEGCKNEYLRLLQPVLHGVAQEPRCVTVIVHDNPKDPREVVLYEIWNCSVDEFHRVELLKPYRAEYMAQRPSLLDEKTVEWLEPVSEWVSDLTTDHTPPIAKSPSPNTT